MFNRPTRRVVVTALAAASLALGAAPPARAADTVIKMGSLKLIHSIAPHFYERFTPAGTKIEVIPFESPTEGKNAVVTKSVDFGMFGIAAATLGAAAGEPIVVIAGACNKGMAGIARKDGPNSSIKNLKGTQVAILPGSTPEGLILRSPRMGGMANQDITANSSLF